MKKLLNVFVLLCAGVLVVAQTNQNEVSWTALSDLSSKWAAKGLDPSDIASMRITDMYTSQHTGVTHIWYVQQYQGVDIADGTYGAHLLNGKVFFSGDKLIRNVQEKITGSAKPSVSAQNSVSKAMQSVGHPVRGNIALLERVDGNRFVFERGSYSLSDVPVRLVYTLQNDQLILAWEVHVEPVAGVDLWKVLVDASTGDIVQKRSMTISCAFPDHYLASPHQCSEEAVVISPTTPLSGDNAQYNVIELPDESPNHGARKLIPSPADIDASPQGWHDTDGIPGPEYTITRGNNVHAFLDRDGNNTSDAVTDGGAGLLFNFPYDVTMEPSSYQHAATTNLFYMNNIMHDFTWHYGFDEFAGNFQQTNSTGLGVGADPVLAHAQFGATQTNPPLNNATFGTPGDGGSGRMRMYLWSATAGNRFLRVDSPSEVAGTYQTSTTDDEWGAPITGTPLTGEVVMVNDGSGNPTLGCNPLTNAAAVNGKIAMIDRGNCEFGRKALRAQQAGAIGFIICNFEEGYVTMAAGADGLAVNIPGIFISNSDCQKLKLYLGTGLTVSFVNEAEGTGPAQRDGSLDNSVIAHEFGHGVSTRLTGGPSNSGCLFNYDHDNDGEVEDGEQMGEGWSDFFALVTTVRPGDTKETARGIATYAQGQDTNGIGLRSYAYTTNMNINPLTYDDVAFQSIPHGIGTVWCSVLWDMYWALVEEYGYDPDLYRGTGGNNLAIQLVMDGMKLQVCNPGLIDGRDAILAADEILTGGANQRLLWEVFARRGLGWSAIQGEERFVRDNTEAFDLSPFVIKELKILKETTPSIEKGGTIDVQLLAVNHKDDGVTGVVVTDEIPEGAEYVNGSANVAVEQQGNLLMFEPGNIASGDTISITYRLATDPAYFSIRYFKDDLEGDFFWQELIEDWPILLWTPQEFIVHSGQYAWGVENIDTISDQSIVMIEPITLPQSNPALVFYQSFDTERFFDGGIVQISDDGGNSWNTMQGDKIIRGTPDTKVPFSLFAVPRLKAWTGDSDGWIHTVINLEDFAGESIKVRFRFASDGNTSGVGWFLDDIEVVDLQAFNSEACITSAEGDDACAIAPFGGTIVDSDIQTGVDDATAETFDFNVFPNPAKEFVNVSINSTLTQDAQITLVNSAGQVMWEKRTELLEGANSELIETRNLVEGFYFIQVRGERDQAIRKIVVQ